MLRKASVNRNPSKTFERLFILVIEKVAGRGFSSAQELAADQIPKCVFRDFAAMGPAFREITVNLHTPVIDRREMGGIAMHANGGLRMAVLWHE
jgi:hypothetical protein